MSELKTNIPKNWKKWINDNTEIGIDKDYIFNVLIEEGYSYESVATQMQYTPTVKHEISDEWDHWVNENLDRGNNKDDIFKILMMHGFSFDCIKERMQYQPNIPLDLLANPYQDKSIDGKNVKISKFINDKSNIWSSPQSNKVKTNKIDLWYVEQFLSRSECKNISNLIMANLRPSEITGRNNDSEFRTSETCDLGNLDSDLIEKIDSRICQFLGLDNTFSEPIQGQYYKVGRQFKPHTDFFECDDLNDNLSDINQRTFTVMIYLNDVLKGGETVFSNIPISFNPKPGSAVIWNNLHENGSPNYDSIHQSKKVLEGHKVIITKWFRQNVYRN